MKAAGTLDPAAASNLPQIEGTPQTQTLEQATAANEFLKKYWDAAVS